MPSCTLPRFYTGFGLAVLIAFHEPLCTNSFAPASPPAQHNFVCSIRRSTLLRKHNNRNTAIHPSDISPRSGVSPLCLKATGNTCDSEDMTRNSDDDEFSLLSNRRVAFGTSRRHWLSSSLTAIVALEGSSSSPVYATTTPSSSSPPPLPPSDQPKQFKSGGYGREEYTNSFVASRDTNISPREAYDSIQSKFISSDPIQCALNEHRIPRALDVGSGAVVSTQILWEMGYKSIDAVDWSGDAWERFVVEDENGYMPEPDVRFFVLDDERYRELWRRERRELLERKKKNVRSSDADDDGSSLVGEKFDTVVFNFAVNNKKARAYAAEFLTDTGRLLAPVNVQTDYWLKQEYRVYDKEGNLIWQAGEVGAWNVQFQPDVTQDTCQGVWCAPYNGFKKMGR